MSFGGLVYYADKFTAWSIPRREYKQTSEHSEDIHTVDGPPCVGCCSVESCKVTWCNAHPLRYKD